MWEGEEHQPQEGGPTPKQRLLNWIQGKIPDVPIKNFTTDWNDGKAIGALVDALAPGMGHVILALSVFFHFSSSYVYISLKLGASQF